MELFRFPKIGVFGIALIGVIFWNIKKAAMWEFPKTRGHLYRDPQGFLKEICKGSIKGLRFRVSEN